jgi:type I restriction enzyme M protein
LKFTFFREGTYFTDDSVLTIATMDAILKSDGAQTELADCPDYTHAYQRYGRQYPHRGYDGSFKSWIYSDNPKPYDS